MKTRRFILQFLLMFSCLLPASSVFAQTSVDSGFICIYPMDLPPVFPGGEDSLKHYILKNLRWPAPDWHKEGTVYVRFLIAEDGSVSNAQVQRGIDSLANSEVLRLVNEMPKWITRDCNKHRFPIWYCVPVRFKKE